MTGNKPVLLARRIHVGRRALPICIARLIRIALIWRIFARWRIRRSIARPIVLVHLTIRVTRPGVLRVWRRVIVRRIRRIRVSLTGPIVLLPVVRRPICRRVLCGTLPHGRGHANVGPLDLRIFLLLLNAAHLGDGRRPAAVFPHDLLLLSEGDRSRRRRGLGHHWTAQNRVWRTDARFRA